MEHIIQFGINIDDNAIKNSIEKNVEREVKESIKQDCLNQIVGKKNVSNFEYQDKLRELIENTTNNFLELYKDEIINAVSDKLAEKLVRTKAIKNVVDKLLQEAF